jgi:putative endonuclease
MTSNLTKRLLDHKSGHTKTTARMKDIHVVYTEEFSTFEDARKRELYFKSAAGRRFLKQKLEEGS